MPGQRIGIDVQSSPAAVTPTLATTGMYPSDISREQRDVRRLRLTDEAEIDPFTRNGRQDVGARRPPDESVRAREADGATAAGANRRDKGRVVSSREHAHDRIERRRIRYAEPVNETRLLASRPQLGVDGAAATVHDDHRPAAASRTLPARRSGSRRRLPAALRRV